MIWKEPSMFRYLWRGGERLYTLVVFIYFVLLIHVSDQCLSSPICCIAERAFHKCAIIPHFGHVSRLFASFQVSEKNFVLIVLLVI